jgi:hypothetical protein
MPRKQRAQERQSHDTKTRPKISFYVANELTADLLERMRDCIAHLSGPPEWMTLNKFLAGAIEREATRLERAHHHGKRFPARPHPLKRGARPR